MGKQCRRCAGEQLITDRHSQPVCPLRVDDLPAPAGPRIDISLRIVFGCQECRLGTELCPVRIVRPGRNGFDIDLVHRVGLTVHIKIEPETEQMLVNRGGQVRRNQRSELGPLGPGFNRADTDDTGQLDLHLNRAVQV